MYLKIGNYVICDSETDGVTKMLTAPTPTLTKESDSIQPLGSTNPAHIQRKGVSREIVINVWREFDSYRTAEVWVVEHMAVMEQLSEHGDLDFESMLGVSYLYGTAALMDVEVVSATGVSVEIQYRFKAGRAITFYVPLINVGGVEYIPLVGDPTSPIGRVIPLIKVAKGSK